MSGPRILPPKGLDARQLDELAKTLLSTDGKPLNIFSTLAGHHLLLKRVNAMGGVFLQYGTLPPRQRELVILRVAARVRCSYEFAQHTSLGRKESLSEDELRAVMGDLDPFFWSSNDMALLRCTDELIGRNNVGDSEWAAVAAMLTETQLLELVFLVGFYRMVAVYLRTIRVQLEPGSSLPDWAKEFNWD
jgi:AhpD family alkylhydroperoxidase